MHTDKYHSTAAVHRSLFARSIQNLFAVTLRQMHQYLYDSNWRLSLVDLRRLCLYVPFFTTRSVY